MKVKKIVKIALDIKDQIPSYIPRNLALIDFLNANFQTSRAWLTANAICDSAWRTGTANEWKLDADIESIE